MPRVGTILFYWPPKLRFGTPALPLPGLPFIYCSSLCLYWASSFSKVSKSSLSVEIVFCVSSRSLSLPSIWLISNFLSFLLNLSSFLLEFDWRKNRYFSTICVIDSNPLRPEMLLKLFLGLNLSTNLETLYSINSNEFFIKYK